MPATGRLSSKLTLGYRLPVQRFLYCRHDPAQIPPPPSLPARTSLVHSRPAGRRRGRAGDIFVEPDYAAAGQLADHGGDLLRDRFRKLNELLPHRAAPWLGTNGDVL